MHSIQHSFRSISNVTTFSEFADYLISGFGFRRKKKLQKSANHRVIALVGRSNRFTRWTKLAESAVIREWFQHLTFLLSRAYIIREYLIKQKVGFQADRRVSLRKYDVYLLGEVVRRDLCLNERGDKILRLWYQPVNAHLLLIWFFVFGCILCTRHQNTE